MEGPASLPPTPAGSNYPILYYGLIVVATSAIVLLLYHLIIVRWCPHLTHHMRPLQTISCGQHATPTTWEIDNLVASFKYKGDGKGQDDGGDSVCAVCLTLFDKGEDIKQLPNCKHYFPAPCIDMWLYSHMNCPLCRSPLLHRQPAAEESEDFRQGLLPPSMLPWQQDESEDIRQGLLGPSALV